MPMGKVSQKIPPLLALMIASAGLNLLWYKRVMIAIESDEHLIFVSFCGLGMLTVALLFDAYRLKRDIRSIILFCNLGGIICTALVLLPGIFHLVGLAGAGLFGGSSFLILIMTGTRLLPQHYRGRAFAFSFLLAGALNTATDIVELPALLVQGYASNIIMACLCLVLCMASIAWKGRAFNWRAIPVTSGERSDNRDMIRIGAVALTCFLLLYVSLSFKESVAYPSVITAVTPSGFIRFVEIPLWLIAGFFTDLLGRRILLGASLVAAFVGAAGILAAESENITALSILCTYFCQIGFPTACVALLADVSQYLRRPAIVGFFAFAPLVLGNLLERVVRSFTESLSNYDLFIADTLILVVFSGLAIWLFGLIGSSLAFLSVTVDVIALEGQTRGLASPAQIATEYDLTKREQEILILIIANKTVRQMAAELYVSESTVKFHITNILKKTASTNRAAMLAKLEK